MNYRDGVWLAVLTLVASTQQGCTTATAAGCGVGVLASVALVGLASAANDDPSTEIDPGAAVLGASLFGVVSGCSAAAVGEALARPTRSGRAAPRDDADARAWPTSTAAAPAASDSGLVTARADLHGVTLYWLGAPRAHPTKIELRLQRYARRAEFADCRQLDVRMDGKSTLMQLQHQVTPITPLVLESLQAETDLETLKMMRAAKRVELHACGMQRVLNLAATGATDEFLARFTHELLRSASARGPEAVPVDAAATAHAGEAPARLAMPAPSADRP